VRAVPFHGFDLTPLRQGELIAWLLAEGPPRAAGYLNAHTFNLASRDKIPLSELDVIYPDGMSVVREARRLGHAVPERVSGADFFLRFCWAAAASGAGIALVGGAGDLANRCAEALQRDVPSLRVVHAQHGFLRAPHEMAALIQNLRQTAPRVVLLGMGSPQQERLALELRAAGIPATWCVGALFEYFTPGIRPHAPVWLREAGLEWVFRLAQEPRRLAGRYLLGNAEFIFRTRLGTGGNRSLR
jgi:exopolysaccharide biosynthesis WecB/TagA/CpsF family protein